MRYLTLFIAVVLSGCAGEYSSLPDATGNWVPANPSGFLAPDPNAAAIPGLPTRSEYPARSAAR